MYNRNSNTLIKHLDFIILDFISFCLSFFLAYGVRHSSFNVFGSELYTTYFIIILLLEIVAAVVIRGYKNILFRGYAVEFRKTLVHTSVVFYGILMISFLLKSTGTLSRTTLILFYIFSIVIVYGVRVFRKKVVIRRLAQNDNREILVVSDCQNIDKLLDHLDERRIYDFRVKGLVIVDDSLPDSEKEYHDTPIIARDSEGIYRYMEKHVVDEIIFVGITDRADIQQLIEECEIIGITVHIIIDELEQLIGDTAIEKMAGVPVVSSSIKLVSSSDLLLKRLIDILGSLVGLIITAVAFIFVAPAIYISDPGPIFFSQQRVGKNGRKFKIYKFRSMYTDAEERKAALMDRNEMQGLMFKMENDPRIIGSGKDGAKRGIGWFIRAFSIDELPQFWNVLIGDMSLVGTRPPTVDEWSQYDIYHRIRMRIKPGLTGLWQVSGRSNITNFEEVVRLDSEYIRSWSMWNDFVIIMKTIIVVLKKEGSE